MEIIERGASVKPFTPQLYADFDFVRVFLRQGLINNQVCDRGINLHIKLLNAPL